MVRTNPPTGEPTNPNVDPILVMTGDVIGLAPFERSLIPCLHRWANDPEISATLGLTWPEPLDQTAIRYDSRVAATDAVWFAIIDRQTMRPVGYAYLYEIDQRHRRASFGIVIGERTARGRGFGTETTRLVIDYAFSHRGLSNVMLTVLAHNEAGLRAYTRAGFREFGRRRDCSRVGQHLSDLIYMEAVVADWSTPDGDQDRSRSDA